MPPKKYFGVGEAKEVRLQQMREYRRVHRAPRRARSRRRVPKYIPTNTHCPGTVAFALLYPR